MWQKIKLKKASIAFLVIGMFLVFNAVFFIHQAIASNPGAYIYLESSGEEGYSGNYTGYTNLNTTPSSNVDVKILSDDPRVDFTTTTYNFTPPTSFDQHSFNYRLIDDGYFNIEKIRLKSISSSTDPNYNNLVGYSEMRSASDKEGSWNSTVQLTKGTTKTVGIKFYHPITTTTIMTFPSANSYNGDITVDKTTLTFTSANYDTVQYLTYTANINNQIVVTTTDVIPYTITVGSDVENRFIAFQLKGTSQPYAGGDGSTSSPYLINNCEQLQNANANLGSHFKLNQDIDCSETASWNDYLANYGVKKSDDFYGDNITKTFSLSSKYVHSVAVSIDYVAVPSNGYTLDATAGTITFTNAPSDGSNIGITYSYYQGFDPIGNDEIGSFVGTFDGNNHNIKNLFINNRPTANVAGLFGTTNVATIKNVNISDAYISGDSNVAVLAASAFNTNIQNCHVTGNVYGRGATAGGLIGGYNTDRGGFIQYNYSTANVFGFSDPGAVSNYGGLVGYVYNSSNDNELAIDENFATGNVSSSAYYVGGLIGYVGTEGPTINTHIRNSYATGNVVGYFGVGGLVGEMIGNSNSEINHSYATGNVTAQSGDGGGLVGYTSDWGVFNSFYSGANLSGDSASLASIIGVATKYSADSYDSLWNNLYSYNNSGVTVCINRDGTPDNSRCTIKTSANDFKGANNSLITGSLGFSTTTWLLSDGFYPTLINNVQSETEETSSTYTLTYLASTGGTISGSTTQSITSGGNGLAVTAVPNSGYKFVNWSDNTTANPRTDTNITTNTSYTANFSKVSSGGGSYAPSAPKIVSTPKLVGSSINSGVSNVAQMAISTSPDFSNTSWVPYNETYKTTDKVIYVKFMSNDGGVSSVYKVEPQITTVVGSNTPAITATTLLVTTNYQFKRILKLGMVGDDVKQLQAWLNNHGFTVANSGAGSSGKETTFFGAATKKALILMQKKYNLSPFPGYTGPVTRKVLNNN